MRILGIDTSTTIFSFCIFDDNKLLYELNRERTFSKETKDAGLFFALQELMEYTDNESIHAIALSIGPGMFTSLRVGLALAKGLNFSRNIPLCGVNTLDVIAQTFLSFDFIKKEKGVICATVMEAFQGEIFVAFYNQKTKISNDIVCSPSEFMHYINQYFKNKKVIAIGPGVKVLAGFKMAGVMKKNLYITDSHFFYPSSSKVVYAALNKIKLGYFDDPDNLEPYYIKKSSAELKGRK
ncbi:MAG: tRNA (adenosine(37)-N6)-threonylcarbamoyltransferase complex dimerization subunit type 1 TsaB [candidate division WOR-3 bacterium]